MTLQATEPLAAGVRLGDVCEILGPAAQGTAGALFEAQDLKQPRKLAVLAPQATAADAERLLTQAQAAARSGHPAVAQVVAADTLPSGAPVLVLEALRGETLAATIARGPLGLDATLRVGREVASALAAAHKEKVVHGRLTADCVVLCPREGAAEQVKVLGFGQAPPDAPPGADVPALARLVHQMLAGAADPGPLDAVGGRAPERVVDALKKAAEPDPQKGFADVVAFMAECSGRTALAGEGGFMKFAEIEEEATVLKPPEKPAAAPVVVGPAPVAAPDASAAPPKLGRGWTIAAAILAIALAVGTLGYFAFKGAAQPAGGPTPAEARPAAAP